MGAAASTAPDADARPPETPTNASSGSAFLDDLASASDPETQRSILIKFCQNSEEQTPMLDQHMLPSKEWYAEHLGAMQARFAAVDRLFPDGLETPWNVRANMIVIMEKLEVSDLLEHLVEQEVVGATDKVEADQAAGAASAHYEGYDLFEMFHDKYDGFESDDDVKGSVALLVVTLLLLVDKRRGLSVQKTSDSAESTASISAVALDGLASDALASDALTSDVLASDVLASGV